MQQLLSTIQRITSQNREQPFAAYSSVHQQRLLNVPIAKPLLIVVLSGNKAFGKNNEVICDSGDFVFFADSPAINMRNIPTDQPYMSLIIEFDFDDFNGLQFTTAKKQDYCLGKASNALTHCLQQFVESTQWAPKSMWSLRKREILTLLNHLGYSDILALLGKAKVSHRLHDMFHHHQFAELSIDSICDQLAMSESTLRRRLKSEGTSVQEVKDQARLGLGLHLLQTTAYSIAVIAEKCGYQSPSRFTERFKGRFDLTPSELRKTKLMD
ncbi:AraC family transcriptional regulator [Alteromonadaceae bacterium BrNp21-10]|nr:AraC family transcriptional regulator [Alteromonadaceae bacterium BrNp21-10]